jgi:hypothetical protein
VSERGLSREVADLRERIGRALCAHPASCRIAVNTELILHPDGTEEAVGEGPPPLCAGCPERESGRLRVRWVQVVRDLRNRHGREAAPSAARIAHNGHDDGPEEHGTPLTTAAPTAPEPERGDGIPAAWGPDHPARLALEGRG